MSESLIVIATGVAGAIALLLRAASTHFDPSQDDEDETQVEIATGDHGGGGGRGGYGSGGLEDTITAELTANPGAGDIKITHSGPIQESNTGRGRKVKGITKRSATQCSHCGAVNKDAGTLCWNCGSNPDTALKEDQLSTINERLRKSTVTDDYVVKKGEEPAPHPVDTAATPQKDKDKFENRDGTTEEDVRKRKEIPIWRHWVGRFLAWVEKWKLLTGMHMRSIVLITLIAGVFWGIGLIYGAARFGPSGFIALFGATIIAVVSASFSALFFLVPGRKKTIGLAYPMALNVVLLPPLVIAMYEPAFSAVWEYSDYVAAVLMDSFLHVYDINTYLRSNYSMNENRFVLMWFGLSYPMGWIIGSSVYTGKVLTPHVSNTCSSIRTATSNALSGKSRPSSPTSHSDTDSNNED